MVVSKKIYNHIIFIKRRNVLKKIIKSTTIIVLFVMAMSIIPTKAKTTIKTNAEPVYIDTVNRRYVNDYDEYTRQLNEGKIDSYNSIIKEELNCKKNNGYKLSSVSEPTCKCSNILGHKWSDWTTWEEISRTHIPNYKYCLVRMRRWRYCTRKKCKAMQSETDAVYVKCCK